MVSVGTIVWLSSELMFFAALFAMYFSIRAAAPELWAERTEVLNIPYATTFTVILVLSSVTCQLGVFAAEKGDVFALRRWFTITTLRASSWSASDNCRPASSAIPMARKYPAPIVRTFTTGAADPADPPRRLSDDWAP